MIRSPAILGIGLLLATALAAPAAFAGTVYRCDSPDGTRTYASKRVKGAKCTVVSSYTPSPAAARGAAPPATVSRAVSEPVAPAAAAPAAATSAGTVPASATVVPASAATSAPAPAPAPPRQGVTRRVEGQVYSYIKDGVRHYTSKPPRGDVGATAMRTIRYSFLETCYACSPLPGVNFGTLRLNTAAYAAEIRAAAAQHGVDEAVVRAIIHAESSFNPNAISRVGAQGLMQLMPATARRFGVTNSFDPAQNIRGGVEYLAWLLKRYNGDLTLAAAGYNAGEGAVDRHRGVPPYNETRRYVERVRVLAERYRGVLGGSG
jgi:soluble lytic murein transglycosylase-like protein